MANEDERRQKPQPQPKLYDRQAKKPKDSGSTPKSSAKPPQSMHMHTRENLTLHDWLMVVDYHD